MASSEYKSIAASKEVLGLTSPRRSIASGGLVDKNVNSISRRLRYALAVKIEYRIVLYCKAPAAEIYT